MKAHRVTTYRVYFSNQRQADLVKGTAGACRYIWNYFLGRHRDEYKDWVDGGKEGDKPSFSYYDLSKEFTVLRNSKEYQWLKDYPSAVVRLALLRFEKSMKQAVSLSSGFPSFRHKGKCRDSFDVSYQNFKIKKHRIWIVRMGWIPLSCRGGDPYLENGTAKSVTVFNDSTNRWYVSVVYEVDVKEHDVERSVGIDMNQGNVATSDGVMFDAPWLRDKIRKRKKYQRMVCRRVKGSNRRKKAKMWLARAFKDEREARKNWCHFVSSKFKGMRVFVEDLKVQAMSKDKGKRMNRENRSLGWYQLRQMLSYKSLMVAVNPAYTSQKCNKCGHTSKANRISQSQFVCRSCGHETNADINASKNILERGLLVVGTAVVRREKSHAPIAPLRLCTVA